MDDQPVALPPVEVAAVAKELFALTPARTTPDDFFRGRL
jgi:hypothetical protein